jgi:hypothetical protein
MVGHYTKLTKVTDVLEESIPIMVRGRLLGIFS